MIKDRLITLLENNSRVSAWKVITVKKNSYELFYVADQLEMNRASELVSYQVSVYTDTQNKRGASSFAVFDYMTEEELGKKIEENLYAASFAMNPFYELPEPESLPKAEIKTDLKDRPFSEIIEDVKNAVFAADVYENGYLSATEFFLNRIEKEILNSKGICLSSLSYSGEIELIPSWERDGEEVEIYHLLSFENFCPAEVTKEVDEQLRMAKARFEAKPLKLEGPVKVILQDEEVGEVFSYFANDLSYFTCYQKSNRHELNECVQGDEISGDLLNLKMVPAYSGARKSAVFDDDGVVLKEVSLIEDGIAKNRYGEYRFGYYLGEKHPTGKLPVLLVKEGKKSFSEMTKEPYIRCVKFSGIQVEENSGYFGGEVRLGFYFDGKKEIPVTGFSISGNLNKSRGTMVYSSETVTKDWYHGPKYLEIRDMTVV